MPLPSPRARGRGERSPATASSPHRSLLRPLGVVGYDAIEPVLLAALATEEPLLLVSDHGAAKTLLLVRLADALGVELRHYNASLLQFDDLVGYPIPDERTGSIRYAAPPGAIWNAEAVFLDEIGRCRPETANKLFPIVHERRVQGVALDGLRFRWAATNPPVEALEQDREPEDRYEGVELLDPALADRFSYVVPLPRFHDLSDTDRLAVIRGAGEAVAPGAHAAVRELVEATRDVIAAADHTVHDASARYVLALVPRLREAKITIGGRRAAMLKRNVVATWAACTVLGRRGAGNAFAAALLASIPDVVRRPVSRAQLLAAHKGAWEQVSLPDQDPIRLLLGVRDPARRAILATTLPGLKAPVRGEALCGALGQLSKIDAAIVAWHLLPRLLRRGRLVPATAVETVATLVDSVASGGHQVRGWDASSQWVAGLRSRVAKSGLADEDAEYLSNALCAYSPLPTQLAGGTSPTAQRDVVERALEVWHRCEAALGAGDGAIAGETDESVTTERTSAREVA
jgi:MoxR-like ATPase